VNERGSRRISRRGVAKGGTVQPESLVKNIRQRDVSDIEKSSVQDE
jgi:cytidylate kinase